MVSRRIATASGVVLERAVRVEERVACTDAPPGFFAVTSLVTVFTTSGPVTNVQLVFFTMKMKSVIAGSNVAASARPMMTLGCAGGVTLRRNT